MTRKFKIAIGTKGRFHVLDLARELTALGHEVTFYSALPDSRVERFGLSRTQARSVLLPMLPTVAWERTVPRIAPLLRERLEIWVLNRAIIARLRPCDIFIGLAGVNLEAGEYAKRKYGARVIAERGSQHILDQKEILQRAGAVGPSDSAVRRELAAYELSDRVLIPSSQALATFLARGCSAERVVVNPYGVDLEMFPRRPAPYKGPPTALFVGRWEYQKGVDILTKAMIKIPEVRLVHVGALGDAPFPSGDQFVHVGQIDQSRLSSHYHSAHVHVLASRQEGLALVQLQALACGLPLISSDQSGARDLGTTEGLRARIQEVPVGDVCALADAIRQRVRSIDELPDISEEDRQALSWRHYGRRYVKIIEQMMESRRPQ